MMSVVRRRRGEVAVAAAMVAAGRELRARTGRRQMETQVAWAKKAPAKEAGERRMGSKRGSEPSREMRVKVCMPTTIFLY